MLTLMSLLIIPMIPIFRPPRTSTVEFKNLSHRIGSSLKSTLAKTFGDSIASKNSATSSGP